MNTIGAQDIKRRGIGAVDEKIIDGPVHVIKNNKLQYVILTEERYGELAAAESDAYLARVKASLEDAKAGRVQKFRSVDDLMKAIEAEE